MDRNNIALKRRNDESYEDYFVRLFDNKKVYDLNCEDIAQLLNEETGQSYTESAYRKEYAAFNRGRSYERQFSEKGVVTRILSISDLHYPYAKPIKTYAEYAGRVDILQLNGDILDCQAISKFPKTYRISPIEEIIGARQYIIELIEYIRPKKVVVTYGNHDLRLGSYVAKQLDNELQELLPETALSYIFTDGFVHYDRKNRCKIRYDGLCDVFTDIEIEYTDNWWCQIGDTIFCHPKTFSTNPMKTAEKALYWFRNQGLIFKSLVMAHTHRIGSYKIGNTTIYEQGACCETTSMQYSDGLLVNSQKEGFIYICFDKDDCNMEDKTKLISLN